MEKVQACEAAIDSQRVIIFSSDAKPAPNDYDLLGDSPGGSVTVAALRESIGAFLPALEVIINDAKAACAKAGLKEVSVALGVDAKGKVGFLGVGSEIGGNATLTLKFDLK
jgi:hypothetical protein